MEIQWNILNPFGITLIAKWWAGLMANLGTVSRTKVQSLLPTYIM
jgi:hypothetical protein